MKTEKIESPFIELSPGEQTKRRMEKTLVWENIPREDLHMIPTMEKNGWKPKFHDSDIMYDRTNPNNVPHNGVSFSKNQKVIWKVNKWIVADLIEEFYKNHRRYDSLLEALTTEDQITK